MLGSRLLCLSITIQIAIVRLNMQRNTRTQPLLAKLQKAAQDFYLGLHIHPWSDQEQLYDFSHLHLKNPVNSVMGSLSSGIWWTFLR